MEYMFKCPRTRCHENGFSKQPRHERTRRLRKYLFVQFAVALAIALFCTPRLFAQETAGNIPSDAKASLPSLLPESSAASPAPAARRSTSPT